MSQARPHVLVVDAEKRVLDRLAVELSQGGFDVTCAESGCAALELVRARRFDLVVADVGALGMEGAEIIAALKAISPDLETSSPAPRAPARRPRWSASRAAPTTSSKSPTTSRT